MSGKVLIVDDEPDLRTLLRANLLGRGYEVAEAPNGPAALLAAMDFTPNAIVLDIMMPGMDGFHILDKLKHHAHTRWIPVILLSAKVSEADRVRGLSLGADDYVTKPFDIEELILRIERRITDGIERSRLYQLSVTDPVSNLGNRRAFGLEYDRRWSLYERGRPLSIIMARVEGYDVAARYKPLPAMDALGRRLGRAIREALGPGDAGFDLGNFNYTILTQNTGEESLKLEATILHSLRNVLKTWDQGYIGWARARTEWAAQWMTKEVFLMVATRATMAVTPSHKAASELQSLGCAEPSAGESTSVQGAWGDDDTERKLELLGTLLGQGPGEPVAQEPGAEPGAPTTPPAAPPGQPEPIVTTAAQAAPAPEALPAEMPYQVVEAALDESAFTPHSAVDGDEDVAGEVLAGTSDFAETLKDTQRRLNPSAARKLLREAAGISA